MVRDRGLLLHGDLRVAGTGARAEFVAFSLAAGDGARLVERVAIVYVVGSAGPVRPVEHEWHDRVDEVPPGAWLPVAGGEVDQLRGVGLDAFSWVRMAPAPGWLGQGPAVWHATGGLLAGFGALPIAVRSFVESARPEFAFAPVVDVAAALAATPRYGRRPGGRRHG